MRKKAFIKGCMGKEQDKYKCEVEWEKHKKETASESGISVGGIKLWSNDGLFRILFYIILFLIVAGVGAYVLHLNNII